MLKRSVVFLLVILLIMPVFAVEPIAVKPIKRVDAGVVDAQYALEWDLFNLKEIVKLNH